MKVFNLLFVATLKDMVRDKMTIFWFLMFPVIFTVLFGFIFSGEMDNLEFDLGVVVEKENGFTDNIVEALAGVPVFKLHQGELEDELTLLKEGERSMVVVLPAAAANPAAIPGEVEIPVYYDQTQLATNQILLSVLGEIFAESERQLQQRPRLFNLKPQPVQAEVLKNIDFLIPGILAMALMQLGLFGSLRLVS
ncbi:MAG TPA: ABC transporter permease, partial [Firmicutes bacterium]|nr:ABC transporter permease [Bacillota bacterium]